MKLKLTTKITVLGALVLALTMAVSSVVLLRSLENSQRRDLEVDARLRLAQTSSQLENGPLPTTLTAPRDSPLMVQVVTAADKIVASTPNVSDMRTIADVQAKSFWTASTSGPTRIEKAVDGAPCIIVGQIVGSGDAARLVLVAAPVRAVTDTSRSMRKQLLWFLPCVLLGATMLLWSVARGAMRQVDRMRAEVDGISPQRLDARISSPPADDELGRLARTMNALLERMQGAQTKQNRFVSDASHELRSPLAVNRTRLEVALRSPDSADWLKVASDVLSENNRMERLVRDLLYLARSDSEALSAKFGSVDLDDVVMQEIESARTTSSVPIDASRVAAARVSGNADQLRRVVANLLENAQRHATSKVSVALTQRQSEGTSNGTTAGASMAELQISDDGPGIAPADRERVLERFARLDAARDRHSGGAGLGLAIVAEIVAAHHATLSIHDTPGGGATIEVMFPIEP